MTKPRPHASRISERGVTLRSIAVIGLPLCALFWWIIAPVVSANSSLDWMRLGLGVCVAFCLILPFVWIGLFRTALRRRATHQEGLLWMLAITAQRGLPLGPGVIAYADYCSAGAFFAFGLIFLALPLLVVGVGFLSANDLVMGTIFLMVWAVCQSLGVFAFITGWWNFRRRVYRLADALNEGEDLYDAALNARGALNRADLLFIRAGQAANRLSDGLREAIEFRRRSGEAKRAVGLRVFYMMLLFCILGIVVSFNLYFIVPRIEAIFKDFGFQELPGPTRVIIIGSQVAGPWIALSFMGLMGWTMLSMSRLQIPFIVLADRLFPHADKALALRATALGTEGELPAKVVLIQMIEAHPKRWMRRKLDNVYDRLDEGGDLALALRKAKLLRNVDLQILQAAIRAGNLPWALRQIAEAWERRWLHLTRWLAQFVFPLMILVLGLCVLGICVALFAPLAQLIQGLA